MVCCTSEAFFRWLCAIYRYKDGEPKIAPIFGTKKIGANNVDMSRLVYNPPYIAERRNVCRREYCQKKIVCVKCELCVIGFSGIFTLLLLLPRLDWHWYSCRPYDRTKKSFNGSTTTQTDIHASSRPSVSRMHECMSACLFTTQFKKKTCAYYDMPTHCVPSIIFPLNFFFFPSPNPKSLYRRPGGREGGGCRVEPIKAINKNQILLFEWRHDGRCSNECAGGTRR